VDDINRFPESIEDNNATNVSFFVTYPRPKITAFGVTNGNAIVMWQTVVGGHYHVQYKDDLSQSNWNDFGNSITAAGSSLSSTNGVAGFGQKYYRVIVN